MPSTLAMAGFGHSVGSEVVSNTQHALACGLPEDWFVERTGIEERRVCAESENVLGLACAAVTEACKEAAVEPVDLGHETVLLHLQNGLTHLTPPGASALA